MSTSHTPLISISVVSHGQSELVAKLLADIGQHVATDIEVILTINIAESLAFDQSLFSFPLRIIRNAVPKGFGANHNAALAVAKGYIFAIVNPDIRLSSDPFPTLAVCLGEYRVGIVAPLVVSSLGEIEDSARRYPTPFRLLSKVFQKRSAPDYMIGDSKVLPDWVAGMFMLVRAEIFRHLGGFDERYYLYYEDVDLCGRVQLAGYVIVLDPQVRVIHDARRESHRNLKYFRWHLWSIARFFLSPVFWRLMTKPRRTANLNNEG
jgi:N-acetylglucosaminyl-diphospho-decaprenol L-rhamnosyltransferase